MLAHEVPNSQKFNQPVARNWGGDFHQDFFWKLFFLPKYIIGVRWFSQFENFYLVKIVFNQNVSGGKDGNVVFRRFSRLLMHLLMACANFDGGPKNMSTKNSHNFWSPIRVATPTHQPKPETPSQILGGFSGTEKLEKVSRFIFSMFRWMFTQNKKLIPKMTWCRCLTATELKALPLQFQAGQVFFAVINVGFSPG